MGRLAGFKYREVVHKLRALGFAFDRLVFSCISKRYMSDCRHEQTSGSHFP